MPTELLTFADRQIEFRFATPQGSPRCDIVMLHEGLGSTSMWRDFPDRLAAVTGARILVYSRLGYGRSTPLSAARMPDYMHDEAKVWLPAILDRLDIRSPILFGHSDGASIALIHAAQPNNRAAAVVALAPHVKVEDLTVQSIREAKIAFETTDLNARLDRYHSNVESAFWGWNRIWLDPAFRSWNIESLLPSIRCPVLAIQGTHDEYGTLEQIESIARSVDTAAMLTIPESRHSPHRDRPEAVLEAVVSFLSAHSLRSPATQSGLSS